MKSIKSKIHMRHIIIVLVVLVAAVAFSVFFLAPNSSATAPSVNMNATPATVTKGGSTQIGWSITNAVTCVAVSNPDHPGWDSDSIDPESGLKTVENITQDTRFGIGCWGDDDGEFEDGAILVRVEKAQCDDDLDNDEDNLYDFPNDPDCVNAQDSVEGIPPVPECADGIDNDGDGKIDATDPRCVDAEGEYTPEAQSEYPRDIQLREF